MHIEAFYHKYKKDLDLSFCAGKAGLKRMIKVPDVQQPGVALTGFLQGYSGKKCLIFGTVEMQYLRKLSNVTRKQRLQGIFAKKPPLVIVSKNAKPFKQMLDLAEKLNIPLFRSSHPSSKVLQELSIFLRDTFAPQKSMHATLVEVFGMGVLIQGDSSIGKSETALGLIERGHRLISDDVVIIRKLDSTSLLGMGPELSRHMLEIRGIGMVNVAHLFGAVCVSEKTHIDITVKIEEWNPDHFYDRVGLEEKTVDVLGVDLPFYMLPIKPGRDVVLLLETLVLNHRLKLMGYNSAKEFNTKLLRAIEKDGVARKKKPHKKISYNI